MDWRVDVLGALGAPVSSANLRFLDSWQRQEGGHTNNSARWNWLNTKRGSYPKMGQGISVFPDYQTGVRETAATISNGYYPNIVAGLRAGDPYRNQSVAGDLSTWVSGSRTAGLAYAGRVLGSIVSSSSSAVSSAASSAAGCGGVLAIAAAILAGGLYFLG